MADLGEREKGRRNWGPGGRASSPPNGANSANCARQGGDNFANFATLGPRRNYYIDTAGTARSVGRPNCAKRLSLARKICIRAGCGDF